MVMNLLFGMILQVLDTLPGTNSSPVKMDGWKMNFLLGPGLFSGKWSDMGTPIP